MPRRFLKLVSKSLTRKPEPHPPTHTFAVEDIIWAMGSFCALNRKPFDAELLAKQFPPPYTSDSFIHAARALGNQGTKGTKGSASHYSWNSHATSPTH